MKRTAISAAASVSKKPRVDASVTSPKAEAVEDEQPVASTSTSTTIASSATNAKIEAFKSSLSTSGDPSEAELLKLELDTIEETWLQALLPAIKSSTFLSLKRFLWKEGLRGVDIKQNSIFPPAQDIYSWSRYTPLDRVRVVILGQDPYHGAGQAHGLCFSVKPGVAVPPSLKNIYKELKTDYPAFEPPKHGYLASWARQGVLLLNTCLTVRSGQANSHQKQGWEEFTSAVIDAVAKREGGGVVWLAWGLPAQKRITKVNKTKHLVLTSAHPSPLSAHKGFFGHAHFKTANDWLKTRYGDAGPIDFTKLETVESTETSAVPLPLAKEPLPAAMPPSFQNFFKPIPKKS